MFHRKIQNATKCIEYLSKSLCLHPWVCVCICFCMITEKINRSRKMKSEYIVVYESSSDKFDTGDCWIKVKVTVGL